MFLRQSTVTTSRAATIMTISIIRSASIIRSWWTPLVSKIWNLITLTGYQQIIWFDYGKIIYRTGIIMHFTTNHTSTHIIIYCPFFFEFYNKYDRPHKLLPYHYTSISHQQYWFKPNLPLQLQSSSKLFILSFSTSTCVW